MSSILGIDEVGRGPWAGPLVIGAVILPKDPSGTLPAWTDDLTDSKKLSAKKRESLAETILKNASATGLGWVSSREIDSLGLSASLRLATRRAVEEVQLAKVPFQEIIIDGTVNFLSGTPLEPYVTLLKKADLLVKEVSAASILAKVARDRYMTSLAEVYPGYGFESHVGYGTAAHRAALAKLGACPEHRTSFKPVAELVSDFGGVPQVTTEVRYARPPRRRAGATSVRQKRIPTQATSKSLGDRAESIVADYLRTQGHRILARNHKTPFYEIDIVSTMGDKIYFTEVKYRKSELRGSALSMIDKKKLQQMTFAAESFLQFSPSLRQNFSPLLAAASVSGTNFTLNDWFVLT